MNKIHKIISLSAIILLGVSSIVFAAPTTLERPDTNDHVAPRISTDYIKANYYVATSTTATSTFANAVKIGTGNQFNTLNIPFRINENSVLEWFAAFENTIGDAQLYFGFDRTTNNAKIQAFSDGTPDQLLLNDSGGNVGIGTTSPYASLSVVGSSGVVASKFTATSTVTTSTFPYASTTGISSVGSAYFGTDGSGKVGVGTNNPIAKIHLVTSGVADNVALDTSGSGIPGMSVGFGGGIWGYWSVARNASNFFTDSLSGDMIFRSEGNKILFGQGSGVSTLVVSKPNVGIGTSTPYAALSVVGASGVVANKFTATTTTATSTFYGGMYVAQTSSSTAPYIYSRTSGFGGHIIIEDEGGAACTEITTKAGVVNGKIISCPPEI